MKKKETPRSTRSKYSSERAFRDHAVRKLKELPFSVWESIQQKSISGSPDVVGCVNSFYVAVEFKKSAKSAISMMQRHKINKIISSRGLGFIAYPENFDAVLEDIRKHCY